MHKVSGIARAATAAGFVAGAALLLIAAPARAQVVNFGSFGTGDVGAGANQLTLNGNASVAGSALRVTPAGLNQAGSAFYNTKVSLLGGFTTQFDYDISGGNAADGFAFLIQDNGLNALGPTGGALGYDGLVRTLAVEFDTFGDIGLQVRTGTGSLSSLVVNPAVGVRGARTARVVYTPGLLEVFLGTSSATLPAVAQLSVAVNLSTTGVSDANGLSWVGFSSGTGAQTDNHDVKSWTLTSVNASAVPEPGSIALFLLGGATAAGAMAARRRRA